MQVGALGRRLALRLALQVACLVWGLTVFEACHWRARCVAQYFASLAQYFASICVYRGVCVVYTYACECACKMLFRPK